MSRWSWLLACFAFAVFAPLIPREAHAHPLGNFTINHYSRLEFADEKARIDYVLDFAEIPTFQQKGKLDPNEDGELSGAEARAYLDAKLPYLVEDLHLRVGKEALPLRVLDSSAAYGPGQGGLPVLRIEARLLTDLPKDWKDHGAGHYIDSTYEDHLGWREIVVRGGPSIAINGSSAPSSGVSDELRTYPNDMLSSPLDIQEATFTLVPGEGSVADGPVGEAARNYSTSGYGFESNGYISKALRQAKLAHFVHQSLTDGDPHLASVRAVVGCLTCLYARPRQDGRGGVSDRGSGNGLARDLSRVDGDADPYPGSLCAWGGGHVPVPLHIA